MEQRQGQAQTIDLSEGLEDYLETIFRVISEKQNVKPKDISKTMNVAGASVTGALRLLAKKNSFTTPPMTRSL